MASKRIATIIGARPQFIKAAPVSLSLRNVGFEETVIHTGQHYDKNMSDVFFEELEMRSPDVHLGIGSGSHGKQTGEMLIAIEELFLRSRPDIVLVYGDTNSTLAGALAASKMHIPLAHVEAGLRSFNMSMPEEINRILTDQVSDVLLTPTENANLNLKKEGFSGDRIFLVGDVMYDASIHFLNASKNKSTIKKRLNLKDDNFVLSTVHRAESTDNRDILLNILRSLDSLSKKVQVVLPLHPRTKNKLDSYGIQVSSFENIMFTDPLGYLDMIALESSASMIVTDSGGVQKEAFFYSKPCVTLRSETEWTELVNAGWNFLVDPSLESDFSDEIYSYKGRLGENIKPYGDGHASDQIAEILTQRYR